MLQQVSQTCEVVKHALPVSYIYTRNFGASSRPARGKQMTENGVRVSPISCASSGPGASRRLRSWRYRLCWRSEVGRDQPEKPHRRLECGPAAAGVVDGPSCTGVSQREASIQEDPRTVLTWPTLSPPSPRRRTKAGPEFLTTRPITGSHPPTLRHARRTRQAHRTCGSFHRPGRVAMLKSGTREVPSRQ